MHANGSTLRQEQRETDKTDIRADAKVLEEPLHRERPREQHGACVDLACQSSPRHSAKPRPLPCHPHCRCTSLWARIRACELAEIGAIFSLRKRDTFALQVRLTGWPGWRQHELNCDLPAEPFVTLTPCDLRKWQRPQICLF
jgi:hypothetical protein